MSNLDNIKQELLSHIDPSDKDIDIIYEELKTLESTSGINDKNNLEAFYDIYKSMKANEGRKKGHLNKINSLLAYKLGMTSEKPTGEFLPKRRAFARAGFPDIDTDFDYERRQEVYDYIIDKYGRENVGNIGTYGLLKMRSFIRRAFKSIDPDNIWQPTKQANEQWITETREKADQIIKSLPPQYGAILKVKGSDGEEHAIKTVEDAYKYCRDFRYYIEKYPDLLNHSKNLEGLVSVYSVHAAGVIISDCPLADIAPLRQTSILKSAGDGENVEKVYEYATQYENSDLELMGLIKFDILALSTLTVISQCISLIKENYDHLADFDIENIPLDDKRVFELYRSGNLVGVFQCEEPGMQKTMKQIGVDRFEDIVAGVALYRPGPMEFIPQYCARKKGNESISYFHKSIEPHVKKYLNETYGLIVYQEQLMQVCNSLAGFSITDGYVMIKAIGKKKKDLLDKFEKDFIDGCEKNGVDRNVSKNYWDKVIVPFADYAFNKCLLGTTTIRDYKTNNIYTLENLSSMFCGTEESISDNSNRPDIYVLSYLDGELVEDQVIDVFETGEKEVFEIELENGMILRCTMDHKFICSDEKIRTVSEILEGGHEIMSYDI